MFRHWLRIRRGVWNKGKPIPARVGRNPSGKMIHATHLAILKGAVRERDRQKATGISTMPRSSMAGSTSGWQMYPRVWAVDIEGRS